MNNLKTFMTQQDKFTAIIEKAEKNGYIKPSDEIEIVPNQEAQIVGEYARMGVIFDHEFLRAYFGRKKVCYLCGNIDYISHSGQKCIDFIDKWKWEGRELAITKPEKRIDYLYKFIKDKLDNK